MGCKCMKNDATLDTPAATPSQGATNSKKLRRRKRGDDLKNKVNNMVLNQTNNLKKQISMESK